MGGGEECISKTEKATEKNREGGEGRKREGEMTRETRARHRAAFHASRAE